MSRWLNRLKNLPRPASHPTKPTKPGFVGSVGNLPGALEISGAPAAAVADPNHDRPTTPANDEHAVDTDRCCWPHSDAMNTAEIERFLTRLQQFIEHGVSEPDAERLADELVLADRRSSSCASSSSAPATPAQPAARSCAACANLTRRGTCTEPVAAGLAETFGIRWPELGQGAGCAAYCSP